MADIDEDMIKEFDTEWDDSFNESFDESIPMTSTTQNHSEPSKSHLETLKKCFGHDNFRPLQWKIINSIINDKRDNCAIMATGYGKSLCFQYPSAYLGGITIVVSPLISLMEDQILSLKISNISACLLGSANTKQKQTVEEIFEDKYTLVYLTPEFALGDSGLEILKRMKTQLCITLIAIDEAHCVSNWGHDFRFQYRELGMFRTLMPEIPILAVTATATPKVQNDVIRSLRLKNPQITNSGFDRPNLYFSVHLKSNLGVFDDIKKYVMQPVAGKWKFRGSTIIFCITRKQTEEVCEILQGFGVNCLAYHAGMSMKERKIAHEKFVKDEIDCVVATIAFGMGIDKPDVRNVVHYGASSSLEGYYQEMGRAGRDGLPSKCVCFYKSSDFNTHSILRENSYGGEKNKKNKEEMANKMLEYLSSGSCRRKLILSHFEGKDVDIPYMTLCCDNCTKKKLKSHQKLDGVDDSGKYDFTQDARMFLKTVEIMGSKFGVGMYVLFLKGSSSAKMYDDLKKNQFFGCGKNKTDVWWKAIANMLEQVKYLKKVSKKVQGRLPYYLIVLTDKGEKFLKDLKDNKNVKLLREPPPEIEALLKPKPKPDRQADWAPEEIPSLKKNSDEDAKLLFLLLQKRTDLSRENSCMPYMVASDLALNGLIKHKPKTYTEMRNCYLNGFSEAKIEKFGGDFIKVILSYLGLDTNIPAYTPPASINKPNLLRLKPTIQSTSIAGCSTKTSGKMSIEDILSQNPLSGAKVGNTALVSYSHFINDGMSFKEIADKRGLQPTTIQSHLTDAMKIGHPIKLIEFDIDEEIRDIIVRAIKKANSESQYLTNIKSLCPEEITFGQIKAVLAYIDLRKHLETTNIPYDDFEDFSFEEVMLTKTEPTKRNTQNNIEPDSSMDQSSDNMAMFLKIAEQIDKDEKSEIKSKNSSQNEQPVFKKRKIAIVYDSDSSTDIEDEEVLEKIKAQNRSVIPT